LIVAAALRIGEFGFALPWLGVVAQVLV
jgi:hypothetical protein